MTGQMILPPFDRSTGQVDRWAHAWDVRVPAPLDRELQPAPLAWHVHRPPCPDGRHVFDVIEAVGQEQYDEAAETSSQRFRLVLTCVRCGLVEPVEGVRDLSRDRARTGQVDPVPLRAGNLRAQQIARWRSYGRDLDTYRVHDTDGAGVGSISWATGKRGRAYYIGRLDAWPDGEHVEGPTALACLRKIAKGGAR